MDYIRKHIWMMDKKDYNVIGPDEIRSEVDKCIKTLKLDLNKFSFDLSNLNVLLKSILQS